MWGIKEKKGEFPYQSFKSLDTLERTDFWTREEFANDLKNTTMSQERYDQLKKDVWSTCKTRKDFLAWYQALDCRPFCQAVVRHMEFYWNEFPMKIDIFKNFCSLPAVSIYLAMWYCNNGDPKKKVITIPSEEFFFKDLRNNMTGGYSGPLRCRLHMKDITTIHGSLMKKVICYDSGGMYLGCLGKGPIPCADYKFEYWSVEELTKKTLANDWIGFARVDICTDKEWESMYRQMGLAPLFKRCEYLPNESVVGPTMWQLRQKMHELGAPLKKISKVSKLINSLFAKGKLLYTPLLKWYLEHGVKITAVDYVSIYDRAGTRDRRKETV